MLKMKNLFKTSQTAPSKIRDHYFHNEGWDSDINHRLVKLYVSPQQATAAAVAKSGSGRIPRGRRGLHQPFAAWREGTKKKKCQRIRRGAKGSVRLSGRKRGDRETWHLGVWGLMEWFDRLHLCTLTENEKLINKWRDFPRW